MLDVGAGAGAASLPLSPPAALLTTVDQSPAMLEVFAGSAEDRGVAHREVEGSWPEVADEVSSADIVVCHNVAYNVGDLVPFAALTDLARARVVIELNAHHPMVSLNHAWLAFHGIERPTGPTAADAAAVLEEMGLEVRTEEFERPSLFAHLERDELVAFARRRLCVGARPGRRDRRAPRTRARRAAASVRDAVVARHGLMSGHAPVPPPPEELSFLAPPGQVRDWRVVVVYGAAAEAGIVDHLAITAATPAGLAAELGLDAHAVRVVLEELAAWDVVRGDDAGCFAPGPAWPEREASAALRHHARAIRGWSSSLGDRLHGVGPPAERTLPPRTDLWLEALAVRARLAAPALVDACLARFPRTRRALELGGGHGEYGLELARRHVEVTMVDRPAVIDIVRPRLQDAGVVLHAGDFFESLPAGPFDMVLCAGVTHTYGGDDNRALFGQAARVTAPGGALAILTYLRGRDPVAPIFAVQMLMAASGADTHAESDYRTWLAGAGYRDVSVVDEAHPRESLLLASLQRPALAAL